MKTIKKRIKSVQEFPLVSVIVPNYNHARFLHQRLDSIFDQSYPNFEVIILDDHSSDNSMEIIHHYVSRCNVSCVICNDNNSGSPFLQWQKGLEAAKGDIIWIAESDDFCKNDFLCKLVATYIRNNCVFAFTRSIIVDENGVGTTITKRHLFRRDKSWQGTYFVKKYMCMGNRVPNASAVIFSRRAALNVIHNIQEFKECGDWMFWIEMAVQGRVAVLSEPLNFFRRHNHTNTFKLMRSGIPDIENKRILDYLKGNRLIRTSTSFIKQKRMAIKFLYHPDYYENAEIKKKVEDAWHLSPWFYVLAKILRPFYKKK